MKLNHNPKAGQAGNALLVTMLTTGILITALGSYLFLTSQENKTVMRSMCWNNALPMAEAGIDEAMTHLGVNTNGYAVDGWSTDGTNFFKQRFLGGDYYNVNFSGDLNSGITITSTGAVQWTDGGYIQRIVQVNARKRQVINPQGLVARGITISGSFLVDGYDSSTNTQSNPAMFGWYDPALHTANAFIGNPLTSFTLGGSANVYGYVASARGYAPPTVAGSASVGDLTWAGKWAQPGHATNGFYVEFADVRAPYPSGPAPGTNVTIAGTNYTYILAGNNYFAPSLSMGSSMYVTGYSRLYVTGAVNIASITFAPDARLELYMSAPSITFAPIINGAAPPQFIVFGLPTCVDMTMTGGTKFVGVIYAPEADLKAVGNTTFYGAIATGTFRCNGNFTLHHDRGTGKPQPPEPLTVLSWAEL